MPRNEMQSKKQKRSKKKSDKVIPFKKKKKISVLTILFYILLIILIMYITLFSPMFNLKTIDVVGNNKFTDEDIINRSGIITGQNILKINYLEAKRNILSNKYDGYIEKVTIKRHFPKKITISIVERKPAAYINYSGKQLLVDKNFVLIKDIKNGSNVPEIVGLKVSKFEFGKKIEVPENNLEKLNAAIECVSASADNRINNLISKIDFSNINKITAWAYGEKYQVNLYDELELTYKIKFLAKILKEEKDNYANWIIDFTSISEPSLRPRI